MNHVQNTYMLAKLTADAARDRYDRAEREFISRKSLRNEDGTIPHHLYAWTNCSDDEWTAVCEEFDACEGGTYRDAVAASEELAAAEESLIDWSLGLIPAGIATTLQEHRHEQKTRRTLISLAMQLDETTIPASIRR